MDGWQVGWFANRVAAHEHPHSNAFGPFTPKTNGQTECQVKLVCKFAEGSEGFKTNRVSTEMRLHFNVAALCTGNLQSSVGCGGRASGQGVCATAILLNVDRIELCCL